MNRKSKRIAIAAGAATVIIAGGTAAWAAWTSTGSASAAGTAGSAQNLTVTDTSIAGGITPGHAVGVTFTVNNPNDYAVNLDLVDIGDFTSNSGACTPAKAAATFTKNAAATAPAEIGTDIPAGGSVNVTWNNIVKLTADPDNDCQGAAYSATVTATGSSITS